MKRIVAIALIISTAVMGGCANNMTSRDYNEATAGKKMKVKLGVVESIRDVKINGKATPLGGMAGGALGAIAGSNSGGGLGQLAVIVVAGAVGAAVGAIADKKLHDSDGVEITVKLAGNDLQAVTQAKDSNEQFVKGDNVRVITDQNGSSRVSH
jgi:outer membrane lipoprotein SlyB